MKISKEDLESIEAICSYFKLEIKQYGADRWVITKPGLRLTRIEFWSNRRMRKMNGKISGLGYKNKHILEEIQILIDL